MRQTLLFLALYLVGGSVGLAVAPRRYLHLTCALGLLIGAAVVVPPVLLLAGIGVPYGALLVVGVMVAIAAAGLAGLRRRGWLERGQWRVVGLWTAGFVVVCIPVTAVNLAHLTYDSHLIVTLAQVLADDAGYGRGLMYEVGDRGQFHIVIQATSQLMGMDFLYALYPMLALSLLAVFSLALWHGVGAIGVTRRRVALVALVVAALFTVVLLQHHVFYVHENLGSAIYLFCFVALFWLAEVEDEPGLVPLAFLALTAFALHRIENPIPTALFLALVVLPSQLPRRALLPWFTLLVVVIAGWELILAMRLESGSMKLSARKCLLLLAMPTSVYLYWLVSRIRALGRFNRHMPVVIAVAVGLAIALSFVKRTSRMVASARAMWSNLTSFDEWGGAWYAIALLAAAGLLVERPPLRRSFSYGVPLFLGFVLLLAYDHGQYVVGRTDSSMRMALHVLPLAFFYLGLQLAVLIRPEVTAASAPRTPPPA